MRVPSGEPITAFIHGGADARASDLRPSLPAAHNGRRSLCLLRLSLGLVFLARLSGDQQMNLDTMLLDRTHWPLIRDLIYSGQIPTVRLAEIAKDNPEFWASCITNRDV